MASPVDVEIAHELVEEQPAQALGRPRVAGEQGPLHDLGQVDQGEDRPVEVGDVAAEDLGLVGGEGLLGVGEHGPGNTTTGATPGWRTPDYLLRDPGPPSSEPLVRSRRGEIDLRRRRAGAAGQRPRSSEARPPADAALNNAAACRAEAAVSGRPTTAN